MLSGRGRRATALGLVDVLPAVTSSPSGPSSPALSRRSSKAPSINPHSKLESPSSAVAAAVALRRPLVNRRFKSASGAWQLQDGETGTGPSTSAPSSGSPLPSGPLPRPPPRVAAANAPPLEAARMTPPDLPEEPQEEMARRRPRRLGSHWLSAFAAGNLRSQQSPASGRSHSVSASEACSVLGDPTLADATVELARYRSDGHYQPGEEPWSMRVPRSRALQQSASPTTAAPSPSQPWGNSWLRRASHGAGAGVGLSRLGQGPGGGPETVEATAQALPDAPAHRSPTLQDGALARAVAAVGALGAFIPSGAQGLEEKEGGALLGEKTVEEALKEALLEKCGSLDHAFCWLDFNSRGHLSRFEFDTGLRVLNLEGPLKGYRTAKLFTLIDTKGTGRIGIQEWRDFFGYEGSDIDEELANGGDDNTKAMSRFSGARGAMMLRKVRNLASMLGTAKRERAADDSELPDESAGSLPKLEVMLALAGRSGASAQASPQSKSKAASMVTSAVHQAEAMQIAKDLKALNYTGVQALVYILSAKCGSLDKAFQWLDYSGHGSFTLVQWETATMIMHIDIEALTGMKSSQIYNKMVSKKGRVGKKSWDRFFAGTLSEADWASMKARQSSFQRRSKFVLKGLLVKSRGPPRRRASAPQRPTTSPKQGFQSKASHRRASGFARPTGVRKVATAALAAGWAQKEAARPKQPPVPLPPVPAAHAEPPVPPAGGAGGSHERTGSGQQRAGAARAAGARAGAAAGGAAGGLEGGAAAAPAVQAPASPERESSPEAAAAPAAAAEPKASPWDLFKERFRQELEALGPDEGRAYHELSKVGRQALHKVAAELGIRVLALGGVGGEVAFREGPEAVSIRQRLEALQPGDRAEFQGSPFLLLFARRTAEALGLEVQEENQSLDVFNPGLTLEDFICGARRKLQDLRQGEVFHLPSNLSPDRLEALHRLVAEFGLFASSLRDPDGGSHLCIGNLSELQAHFRAQFRSMEPGSSRAVAELLEGRPDGLSTFARELAHELLVQVAEEEGLVIEALMVSRPATGDASSGRASSAEDEVPQEPEGYLELPPVLDDATVKERVSELFNCYCSGKQGRTNIFLRKPDLTRFVNDALAASKKKAPKKVLEWIELLYDETLELQVDMGSRYYYGIVVEFFQVFLSKTAEIFERSLVGLLMDLLQWYHR